MCIDEEHPSVLTMIMRNGKPSLSYVDRVQVVCYWHRAP